MDQIHLDPQDKLPPHPPPLWHIVNKTPSTHRTKTRLRPTHPPPEDNFWNSPKRSTDSMLLTVPRTRHRWGDRAFSRAGPILWNDLPLAVRSASSLASFKLQLKTLLFTRPYDWLLSVSYINVYIFLFHLSSFICLTFLGIEQWLLDFALYKNNVLLLLLLKAAVVTMRYSRPTSTATQMVSCQDNCTLWQKCHHWNYCKM